MFRLRYFVTSFHASTWELQFICTSVDLTTACPTTIFNSKSHDALRERSQRLRLITRMTVIPAAIEIRADRRKQINEIQSTLSFSFIYPERKWTIPERKRRRFNLWRKPIRKSSRPARFQEECLGKIIDLSKQLLY